MKLDRSSLVPPIRAALIACGLTACASGALEVAGELLIDLDATDYNTAEGVWPQHSVTGIPGNFTKQATGTPQLQLIGGKLSLVLDGDGDYLTGPVTTAALHAPNAPHTVEYWVFQGQTRPEETVISWSSRNGPGGTHAAFRYGTGGAGAIGRWDTPDMAFAAPHSGGPAVGVWHHIVATFDGTTQRVYVDGQLNASEASSLDAKDGLNIYIGAERNNDGTESGRVRQFSGAVSKVRVHAGALSATQVLNNYNVEAAQHPGITATPLSHPPLHRWSFSEAAGPATEGSIVSDSIGGLTGIIRGTGATFTGTGVTLPGGLPATLPAYVDLPNGLVSSKQRLTLEVWATQTSNQAGSRMMSFNKTNIGEVNQAGNATAFSGTESIALYSNTGSASNMRLERNGGTTPNGGTSRQSENGTTLNAKMHYVVTYDTDFKEWRLYRNGFLMETLPELQGPTTIGDVNNWLGRSDFGVDSGFAGTFDEFRIYNYTLSESEIRGNTLAGPDTLTAAAFEVFRWTPTVGGEYAFNNAGGQQNWGAGNSFPNAPGAMATMTGNLTGDQTVALNTTAALGHLSIGDTDGSHALTLAPGTGGVLEMNAGTGLLASLTQSSTSAPNEISAPLLLTSDTELANTSSAASLTLSGALSGPGKMSKAGSGRVILTADNQAYSGALAVNSGPLLVGNGGTTGTLGSGPVTLTDEGVLNFNRQDAITVANTITGAGAVRFSGPATLTGTVSTTGIVTIDGTSSLSHQGAITAGTTNVEGELVMDQDNTLDSSVVTIGESQSGPNVLRLNSGTVNTPSFVVARNAGTAGVILQSGGTLNELAGGPDSLVGGTNNASAQTWGAYRMTGGILNTTNHFQVGGHGIGVMEVENATVNFNGGVPSIGRFQNGTTSRGRGLLDVRSGAFVSHNAGTTRMTVGEKGTGTLNVRDGGAMFLNGGLTISAGGTADPGDGTVNLLEGGTIEAQLIARGGGTLPARFNFNGGVLRARGNQPGANQTLFMTGCNAYVYGGGALIDSNGFNIRVAQIFEDPAGNGLATIPVVNGGSGYLAPPYLEITGDGTGASAIANLVNGVVTSITITNPGTNYTTPPLINILGGGAGSGLTLGTPTLAGNLPGDVVKKGLGSLSLEGASVYTGTTKVEEGTLLMNADHSNASGDIEVAAGATLGGVGILASQMEVSGSVNPGRQTSTDIVGMLTNIGNVSFTEGSTLMVDIDDGTDLNSDSLNIIGHLDLQGAALSVNVIGEATQLPYTIASFDSLEGEFASVPQGVTVVYNENSIEITAIESGSSYQSWIAGYFPGETDPLVIGADADPDKDGSTNLQEYALGGEPGQASSGPKVFFFPSDRGQAGAAKDMVMTVAVLEGTPGFTGNAAARASLQGITYSVEGSLDLDQFASPVVEIEAVTDGLGNPPEGYEFRSFMLSSTGTVPAKGFMRVEVTETAP